MDWIELSAVGATLLASMLAWRILGGRNQAALSDELKQVPASLLADAREGSDVRLKGRVVMLGKPLEAPLSGRPCVAWYVSVRSSDRTRTRRIHGWETIIAELDAVDFVLRDASEEARVTTGTLEVELVPDFEGGSGLFITGSERLEPFLAARGKRWKHHVYEFTEAILRPGDIVNIRGSVHTERRPLEEPSDYRGSATGLRVEAASDGLVLVAIDQTSPARRPFRPVPPPPPPSAESTSDPAPANESHSTRADPWDPEGEVRSASGDQDVP